jgi:hypothetical protein
MSSLTHQAKSVFKLAKARFAETGAGRAEIRQLFRPPFSCWHDMGRRFPPMQIAGLLATRQAPLGSHNLGALSLDTGWFQSSTESKLLED